MDFKQQAEHKMIQISDDFALVAEYLKQELANSAYNSFGTRDTYEENKTKYQYLTTLVNTMSNLKYEKEFEDGTEY
ncbi:TPA: hypothetical protein NJ597_001229 [Vibrio parahaemolyticus]|nr:hypothetical protein [Vibrio parahaemolyticus]